jgi:hypothetical protein
MTSNNDMYWLQKPNSSRRYEEYDDDLKEKKAKKRKEEKEAEIRRLKNATAKSITDAIQKTKFTS